MLAMPSAPLAAEGARRGVGVLMPALYPIMSIAERDPCERLILPQTEPSDDHRCQAMASPRQTRISVPRRARGHAEAGEIRARGADDGQTVAFPTPRLRASIRSVESRSVDFGGKVDNTISQKHLDRDSREREYPRTLEVRSGGEGASTAGAAYDPEDHRAGCAGRGSSTETT